MSGAISRRRGLPAPEVLAEMLRYADGQLFWLTRPRHHFKTTRQMNIWNAMWAGKRAGSPTLNGYRSVGIDCTKFLEHRLIFYMVNGEISDTAEIDHIDRDRSNNRFENLRACTHTQNAMNQPGRKRTQALPKHVYWSKLEQKFKVYFRANGKRHNIGTFAGLAQAIAAAKNARARLHGEYEYRSEP